MKPYVATDVDPIGAEAPLATAIEKAVLLDENDNPIPPGGGLTADLKATQASEISVGNLAVEPTCSRWWISSRRFNQIKRAVTTRWGTLSGSPEEKAHLVEVMKERINQEYD